MTNRPKDPARAEIARAIAEQTGGAGLKPTPDGSGALGPGGLQQLVVNADMICRVADAVAARAVIGNDIPVGPDNPTGRPFVAKVPHFAVMLQKARDEWKEPTEIQAAKLELLALVQRFQEDVYKLAPRINALLAKAATQEAPPVAAVEPPAPVPASADTYRCNPRCPCGAGDMARELASIKCDGLSFVVDVVPPARLHAEADARNAREMANELIDEVKGRAPIPLHAAAS
jgi:hypothetical protein